MDFYFHHRQSFIQKTDGENMPPLKTEKEAEKRQTRLTTIPKNEEEGKGLKLMTPNQLLTRLPILHAQKKAGNNSLKLNNEIRPIIYSLYSSKNISKTIYNHF